MTFGKFVEKLRIEKKYSQRKLAQLSGISNTTISRIESDDSVPELETVAKLANAFKIPVEELLQYANIETDIISNLELKEIGVDYIKVTKELKDQGLSPDDIREIANVVKKLKGI